MILIIDDQKNIGTGLERLLRYAGYETTTEVKQFDPDRIAMP